MADEIKKTETASTEKPQSTVRAHSASAQAEGGSGKLQRVPHEAHAASASPSEAELKNEEKKKVVRKKKGKKRNLQEAHLCIQASYNNTIVTITEPNGNVICWASSGSCGFKGTRKATPYAASVACDTALTKAKALGVERVHISIKGTGSGRDQALRAVNASGVSIESISDKTAVPHNGCRARKARRI